LSTILRGVLDDSWARRHMAVAAMSTATIAAIAPDLFISEKCKPEIGLREMTEVMLQTRAANPQNAWIVLLFPSSKRHPPSHLGHQISVLRRNVDRFARPPSRATRLIVPPLL
jgi:hypothetical protein